jgi:hypothetical protein
MRRTLTLSLLCVLAVAGCATQPWAVSGGQKDAGLVRVSYEFEEFRELYPLVARFLDGRYREAGEILVDEEPRFRVFTALDRPPVRTDPELGLPCFA